MNFSPEQQVEIDQIKSDLVQVQNKAQAAYDKTTSAYHRWIATFSPHAAANIGTFGFGLLLWLPVGILIGKYVL